MCIFFEITGMHQANSRDFATQHPVVLSCILGECKCKQSASSESRFSFVVAVQRFLFAVRHPGSLD